MALNTSRDVICQMEELTMLIYRDHSSRCIYPWALRLSRTFSTVLLSGLSDSKCHLGPCSSLGSFLLCTIQHISFPVDKSCARELHGKTKFVFPQHLPKDFLHLFKGFLFATGRSVASPSCPNTMVKRDP
jgi:hypothetical protein